MFGAKDGGVSRQSRQGGRRVEGVVEKLLGAVCIDKPQNAQINYRRGEEEDGESAYRKNASSKAG